MATLATSVTVDGTTYPADTADSAMPAGVADRIRNGSAWTGGAAPALSATGLGNRRLRGALDLQTPARAARALGLTEAGLAPHAIIANMGTPMRTAHRTGGSASGALVYGPAPENTLEGARLMAEAASSQNIANFVINLQCRLLGDGSVAVVHDATLTRTMTATGNVADHTAGSWRALSIDAATYTGAASWGDAIRPALLDDFLREFGGKVALNIAAYQGTAGIGAAVVNKVAARGLGATVMVGSFQTAELLAAKAAGMATIYYPPSEGETGATAVEILATAVWAAGLPKYVGVDSTSTDGYIQGLIAAGLHVGAYFTARRYDAARLLALGVQHLISDDPVYQFTSSRLYAGAVDPYTLGAWPHGALPGDGRTRGVLSANGQKLDDTVNVQHSVQGSRCPIVTPTAYTITGTMTLDAIGGDTTRSAQLTICCPDDRVTTGVPSSASGVVDGYAVLIRANGNVELWKNTRVGQGNTKVGSTLSTTAITATTTIGFTVQVTPTTVVFTRTDGTPASVTWTDSTWRGTYYHVGKNGTSSNTIGVSWSVTSIA